MNKKLMKPFAFIFSFLLIFANLAFVQPSETFAKTLDNAVTISVLDTDGGDIVGMQAVEIEDGDTALDVLEEVAEVEAKDSQWGPEIKKIEGVYADYETTGSYWAFYVNGGYASVGASGYEVQHGDNILFLNNNEQDSLETTVTIEGFETTEVETSPYSTAYDAIKQAVNSLEIPIDFTFNSEYFVFIENFSNKTLKENEFWSFIINDEMAAVGVSKYRLNQADHLSYEVGSFELEDGGNEDDTDKDDESKNNNDTNDDASNDTEDNDKQNNEDSKESTDDKESAEKEETTDANPNIATINGQVTDDLTNLKKEIEKQGLLSEYGHEAYVWAYAKAGGKVPTEYRDNIAKALTEEDNFTTSTNELAKVVIALSEAGFDAENIGGVNLVDTLANHEGILTGTSVATPTYVLHALDLSKAKVDESIKEDLLDVILTKQLASGGWGFFGDTASADITGMVLNTLAPYKSDERVATAAAEAIDYLADGFDGTGWYHDSWSGGYTSEAISQVIVGLSAYGVNPTEAPFVDQDGKDLLSYLLEFKAEDGLFKHVATGEPDPGFATSQAFLALAYYQDAFIQKTEEPKDETPSIDDRDDNDTKVEEDKGTTTDDSKVKVTEDTTKTEEVNEDTLPATNSNVFNILAIGLLSLATGFVLVVLRRKWQSA